MTFLFIPWLGNLNATNCHGMVGVTSFTAPPSYPGDVSNTSYPVYRQTAHAQGQHGDADNYIFYFSHPQWAGWLVGPQLSRGRGGLLAQGPAPCPPTRPGAWRYYSPEAGFLEGEVSLSCDTGSPGLRGGESAR